MLKIWVSGDCDSLCYSVFDKYPNCVPLFTNLGVKTGSEKSLAAKVKQH